ncbi:MAG TPA: proton-conducting transporter membrane subunit [Phycisphaerae bacterium]
MNFIVWSLIVLLVGAVWSLLSAGWPRWSLAGGLTCIAFAGLAATSAGLIRLIGGGQAAHVFAWLLPLGTVKLAIDGLSACFLVAIGISSVSAAVYSWGYWQHEMQPRAVCTFSALLCVMVAAMVLVVCAADVVLFLASWELMSLAAFFLIGLHDRDPAARRGAWMYLIATHLGTALFVVPVLAFASSHSGSTDFESLRAGLGSIGASTAALLLVLGLIGFGTKAGFMPMHVWLPIAHPVAPTPVSALLSGVVVKTGIYGLLRLLTWLPTLPVGCAVAMLIVGAVSGVLGVLYALAQHDIKRLLAYHTVENIGIIGLGIGMGMLGQSTHQTGLAALGYAGALLHVLNHALFKGLLFLSGGAVIHSTGTGAIDRLGGLARQTPRNAALFLVGAVAICGLPPLNGFVSEWLIYGSLFGGALQIPGLRAATPVLGLVSLALMGGLALACFSKVFAVVFLGEPRDAALQTHGTPGSMLAGMALLALLCVAIGVLPGVFVPLLAEGVGVLTRQSSDEFQSAIRQVWAPATALTWMALVLASFVALLAIVRRQVLGHAPRAARVPTWGCGYPYPSPRMQYSASSFAWSLISSFRSLLWPRKEALAPIGPFPQAGHLETHTADLAEEGLFAPLFAGIARLFAMARTLTWTGRPTIAPPIRPPPAREAAPLRVVLARLLAAIRRGSIQVYLTFMVLTLIILFLIEGFSSGRVSLPANQGSAGASPSRAGAPPARVEGTGP